MTATQTTRCFFDVVLLREIHRDLDGIDVSDFADAIAQARTAISEVNEEDEVHETENRFGEQAFLLVRDTSETLLCVIRLDE